jgi:hypothetical protein
VKICASTSAFISRSLVSFCRSLSSLSLLTSAISFCSKGCPRYAFRAEASPREDLLRTHLAGSEAVECYRDMLHSLEQTMADFGGSTAEEAETFPQKLGKMLIAGLGWALAVGRLGTLLLVSRAFNAMVLPHRRELQVLTLRAEAVCLRASLDMARERERQGDQSWGMSWTFEPAGGQQVPVVTTTDPNTHHANTGATSNAKPSKDAEKAFLSILSAFPAQCASLSDKWISLHSGLHAGLRLHVCQEVECVALMLLQQVHAPLHLCSRVNSAAAAKDALPRHLGHPHAAVVLPPHVSQTSASSHVHRAPVVHYQLLVHAKALPIPCQFASRTPTETCLVEYRDGIVR